MSEHAWAINGWLFLAMLIGTGGVFLAAIVYAVWTVITYKPHEPDDHQHERAKRDARRQAWLRSMDNDAESLHPSIYDTDHSNDT